MKTAIVTGGTRGIGLGIARSLARDGYNLVLGYHANHEAAQKTKETLENEFKIKVSCCSGDIILPETMAKLFNVIENEFNNELTTFVHNAGLYVGVTTEATGLQPKFEDDFAAIFDYYQKVYPQAFKRGMEMALKCNGFRHAIAISSPGCNCNQSVQVGYEQPGQAKSSMEFLVRLYARRLANQGITVNCVIPGIIRTEAWDCVVRVKYGSKEFVDKLVENSASGRWGEPSEIGDIVAFLCSNRALFITGTAIPVDGGLHLSPVLA